MLQTVARAGDIYRIAMSSDLDISLAAALGVGCPFRQFKEAVHGYGHLHLALRHCLPPDLPYGSRRRVAGFGH